jgi:hypothetical protein
VKAEARALIESLLSVEKEILKGGSADAPS